MSVDRLLPTQEAHDLIDLTREIADKVLAPIVDEHEKAETYPEGVFATLGEAGLLSLPYPEEFGGGGQPYEVYLQVLEEIAARWAAVGVAVAAATVGLVKFGEAGAALGLFLLLAVQFGVFGGFFGWPNLTVRNAGGFMGMPAGPGPADMRVVDMYRVEDGKLAENWIFIDLLHFLFMQGLDVLGRMAAVRAGGG